MNVADARPVTVSRKQIDALETAYRDLLNTDFADTPATPEEQQQLDRIQQKINELKALADDQASTVAIGDIKGESAGSAGGNSAKGRARMGNRLTQMQAELDGLLKDLESTTVG